MTKLLFSQIAIVLTLFAFVPYFFQIVRQQVRPHIISWLIWGVATTVIFIAQLGDGAGVGAWPVGVSALLTLAVASLAFYFRTDTHIDNKDRLAFAFTLLALPLWYFTSEPLYALIILSLVDLSGFIPTIRKINRDPYTESAVFFALFASRNLFILLALEHYSAVTMMFPSLIGLTCLSLIGYMFFLRGQQNR